MTSSTSNSKEIWRPSLALAVILIAIYAVLVRIGKVPSGQGISQYQLNWVTMEKFAADGMPGVEAVICGSSMGQTLKPQLVDQRFYNLSILGTSGLTGLKVVNASRNRPRVVFVEMSHTLVTGYDKTSLTSMMSPYRRWVASNAKFLRQDYQPTDILLSKFKRRGLGGADNPASEAVLAAAVKRHTPLFEPFEDYSFEGTVRGMKAAIADVEAKGSRVVLLELLAAPEVEATPKFQHVRRRIAEEFGANYTWLRPLAPTDVVTSDGIHLVPSVAARVTKTLIDSLD